MRRPLALGLACVLACATKPGEDDKVEPFALEDGPGPADVLTWHYDGARTGVQAFETTLKPSVVATRGKFGKSHVYAVDGDVYAQPLYVSRITIAGAQREVLYVATQHDSVYAFDATGAPPEPLWQVSLLGDGETPVDSEDTESADISPEIGITGTPVIDRIAGVLYVVAKSAKDTPAGRTYTQRMHALSLATGAEMMGGPSVIAADIASTSDDAVDGRLHFEPLRHNQRSALALSNGHVWVTWAAHGDKGAYHGWVMAFDAKNVAAPPLAWTTTPDGIGGGIWMGAGGPSVDDNGDVYVSAGNGAFDDDVDSDDRRTNFASSALRLRADASGISLVDWFTPSNQDAINGNDMDFGTAAMILLPGRNVLAQGKNGMVFVLARDAMSHYWPQSDHVVQSFTISTNFLISNPAFFNGSLYVCKNRGPVEAYALDDAGRFPSDATDAAPLPGVCADCFRRGSTPSISANGVADGIVWAIDNGQYAAPGPAVLHAYSAADLSQELYSSATDPKDNAAFAVKFTTPTIANGRVFVGGQGFVTTYGVIR
jgi:hypothetical protein